MRDTDLFFAHNCICCFPLSSFLNFSLTSCATRKTYPTMHSQCFSPAYYVDLSSLEHCRIGKSLGGKYFKLKARLWCLYDNDYNPVSPHCIIYIFFSLTVWNVSFLTNNCDWLHSLEFALFLFIFIIIFPGLGATQPSSYVQDARQSSVQLRLFRPILPHSQPCVSSLAWQTWVATWQHLYSVSMNSKVFQLLFVSC